MAGSKYRSEETRKKISETKKLTGAEDGKRVSKAKVGMPYVKGANWDETHHKPNSEDTRKGAYATHAQRKLNKVVQNEMLGAIREGLNATDKKGVPYYQRYVQKFLDNALNDPEGVCSRMLSSGLFNEKLLATLDKEATEAMNKETDFVIYRLRQTLFDKQKELFDNDTDKQVITICSRRSGKTECNARILIKKILKKGSPCLYINKTFQNAIDQLFDLVIDTAESIGIHPSHSSKSEGIIEFGNGSSIRFAGVSNIESIEKLRGFKFRCVIIDEIGHLGKNMDYLIDQVLIPAMADFSDSQMFFTGTPPRSKNYAVRLWDSGIKKYHWTLFDNPFIPDAEGFLKDYMSKKGLTIDDPLIQREWFGVVGAWDTEAQVFKGFRTYKDLPKDFNLDRIYIGVDFGFVDYNGIVSIMVDNLHKQAYAYRCRKFNKAGMEEIVGAIQAAYEDAQGELLSRGLDDKGKITIVTDTNEPALAFDLHKKYGLPVEKAYKYDEAGSWSETATALRTRVFTHEDCKDLITEYESTVWKRNENDDLIPEIDDDIFHPDAADALRYALRNILERWGNIEKDLEKKYEEKPSIPTPVVNVARTTLPPGFGNNNKGVQSLGRMQL